MSLVWRIALIALAVLVSSVGALAYYGGKAMSAELTDALRSRSQAVAMSLAIQLERIQQYGIAVEDIEGFDDQLGEAVRNYEGLSYALVLDNGGTVLFRHGRGEAETAGAQARSRGAGTGEFQDAQALVKRPGGATAGRVIVGYRTELVSERVARIERDAILLGLAVFAAGAALLVVALRVFVQRPLLQFAHTIEQVREGKTLLPRVRELRQAEFRSVAASFNTMLDELQRQAEALRQAKAAADSANDAKSLFLSKMSHEIRTPMNGVMGMTDMLLHTPLNDMQKRFASAALRSSEALLAIINDVLDFAKIESGRMELEQIPFDMRELIQDALAILEPSAAAKGVALDSSLDPSIDRLFVGDPLRVRQIIWNLLSNAVKFTDEGHVCLRAAFSPDGLLRVEVEDTGIGLSEEALRHVFEPFRQSDNSVARKFGGTGLGLTIARELAVAMGGTITGRSTAGEGSTFTAELRFSTDPRPRACARAVPRPAPAPAPPPQGACRLLIVDDNELNREILEAMLDGQGFELHLAADGPAAFRMFGAANFNLVLMDCSMPGMDGYEATRLIRRLELRRGAPRVPIIALTGNVAPDARRRCEDAGMDDYLSKPCPRDRLLDAVRRWLALRQDELSRDAQQSAGSEPAAVPVAPDSGRA